MNISIKDLTKTYGKQTALDNVSFAIENAEIVGLLGPNGAGKSTLMKSIVGAIDFDSGDINIGGIDIRKHALQAKKTIGFLPENNPLYTDMYVKEYLGYVAGLRGVATIKINQIIQQVGLSQEQNKKIHQLSKGYKQRVGLAQAILAEPEVLILDEPTNGLDPNQIIEIRQLIQTIGKQKTVILSTHIMQEVEALCSRVILLNHGKIVANQSIAEFKGQYQNLEQAFAVLTKKSTV